jgi:hypothetical protein
MKVSYTDYAGRKITTSLADALTPSVDTYDQGRLEATQAQASKGLEIVGSMLAVMVEKKVLTLSEALEISGQSYSLQDATLVP